MRWSFKQLQQSGAQVVAEVGTGGPAKSQWSNAKKTQVDGILFDSKAEAKRYCELKWLQQSGEIQKLELQPRFEFIINGTKCGHYTADFRYIENGQSVVEEVKGREAKDFRLRWRITQAMYPQHEYRLIKY